MEAFQLRLWDGRLGRWLSVDPYGQYHSPYLGMGNNPINLIDPDGGMTKEGDPPGFWGRLWNSITSSKYLGPSLNPTLNYTTRIDIPSINPEVNGFKMSNPFAQTTQVQHALGEFYDQTGKFSSKTNSSFISTSELFFGAKDFRASGNQYWIDMDVVAKKGIGYTSNLELMTVVKNSLDTYPPVPQSLPTLRNIKK